ncbi:MAG: SH3 domain-containing protein [Chitinispirillales bacterium]|jgi:hypothetical protein|nr:SH3 domain-containing protein [Chitinispirillales bacterium]
MRVRTFRKLLAASVVAAALLVGCGGDGKSREPAQAGAGQVRSGEEAGVAEAVQKEAVWEGEYLCKHGDAECRDDKMFGTGIYFNGTVFNTVVNADVNVRSLPSTSGAVLFQAKKDTKVQVLGISRDGWAYITTREVVPRRGWASGQFLDYREERRFTSTDISIVGFTFAARDSSVAEMMASYKIDGVEKTMNLRGFKEQGQNFFTFFYDTYVENSHYTIIPGLYTWQSVNNRLTHRTFLTRAPRAVGDNTAIWDWVAFSDDFKYYFIREEENILVFQAGSRQRILSETAVSSFNPSAKTVTCDCPSDEMMAKHFSDLEPMDGVIAEYAAEYESNNPRPEDDGGSYAIRVTCEVNVETGPRKIIGAEWRSLR